MSLRERNKQEKLQRITVAAQKLFSAKGVSDVTTNEVAKAADVATGTLFLYAKTKGELLLLAQNANYREAHEIGIKASTSASNQVSAIIALVTPIVICNREHVENGLTYLREVMFGEGLNSHRAEALTLMLGTEAVVAEILQSLELAKVVMATLFLALSSPNNRQASNSEILQEFENQLLLIVR